MAGLAVATGAAGQAAGTLVGPAVEVGKVVYRSLKRKHDYRKNLDRNFKGLEMVESFLSGREKDVQELANITHEGHSWLVAVKEKLKEVEELRTRYYTVKAAKNNVLSSRTYKLSKEIVELTNSVHELRDEMNTNDALGRAICEKKHVRAKQRSCSDIAEVPSQRQHVEDLLELLKDDTIKRIGIWGIFGVGKTTILEKLYDQVHEKLPNFKPVLWVTASNEMNIHQIHKQIMDQLKIHTELPRSSEEDARLISQSIGNSKYLLFLDNVFSVIDLHRIGFPDNRGCKVILATRERRICNEMNTNDQINVRRLSRDDARQLFHDVLGEQAPQKHPSVEPVAERVLKQCGGLPHIIRAVGSHLKDKPRGSSWRHTLKELQSPNMCQLKPLEDVLKNAFNLIFEDLDDILKDCWLYAASFPEDHEICREYLIECWMGQEVIRFCDTFKNARDEGDASLDIFIGKCLFDSCTGSKVVKMPILFRNTALGVAQREFGLLVRDSKESKDPPIESWRNAKVISMIGNGVQLPDEPMFSTASILFLQKNEKLSVIPQSFFDYMSALRILDMSGTGITTLPQSISKLTSLTRLYLTDCEKLEQLPDEVERLENLELLDIRGIGVYGLDFPAVIGKLTKLRCLRVSLQSVVGKQNSVVCNQNSVAANGTGVYGLGFPAVIGKFTWHRWPRVLLQSVIGNQNSVATLSSTIKKLLQLEELTIDVVDLKDLGWNMIEPDVGLEVARLQKLSSISFWFSSIGSLETFTRSSKSWNNGSSPGSHFRSFNIYVGSEETHNSPRLDVFECVEQRYLYYYGGKDTSDSTKNVGIKSVLRWTCAFELIAHDSITYFSDFGTNEMEHLEICRVEGCNEITAFLLSSQTSMTRASFPCLKELQLFHLQKLNAICQGDIASGSFKELRTLTINHCPNLIELLSWEMAQQLCNLQDLRVENCAKVEEIVASGNQSGGEDVLPKLKNIHLNKLESLISIHSDDSFKWCKLQSVEINECNKLVNLCLSETNATKLRCIKCKKVWFDSLTLDDEVRSYLKGFCPLS